MLHRIALTVIWLTLALAVGLGVSLWNIHRWSDVDIELTQPVVMEFPRKTKLSDLARDLSENGLISSSFNFRVWVRIQRNYHKFQAGTYRFEGSLSPKQLVRSLIKGDTYRPVVAQFTIPEGFNLRQIGRRLEAHDIGSFQEFWKLAHDPKFLRKHKVRSSSLEGYLYPATYQFFTKPQLTEVVEQMIRTFRGQIPSGYDKFIYSKGLSFEKAIIFASLIELETKFDDEKTKISEVIWRRLKNNEPLGIDAALIYGIEDYDGDIKWSHLRDAKNPYNTRIHTGLPPTAIGAPSRSSLEAVLNPTDEGYHYYVLAVGSGGRHQFSRTLVEHNRYVRELVKASKDKNKNK